METLTVISALIMVSMVNAETVLSVNLISLYNQNSEVYTNNQLLCCNDAAKLGQSCVEPCNVVLHVCYRPRNLDPCQQTGISTRIQKQRNIRFTSTIGNLSNPIIFHAQHWTFYSGFTVKAFEDYEQTRIIGIFDVFPYLSKVDTSLNTARVHEQKSIQDGRTHAYLHVTFKVYDCTPDFTSNRVCDSNGQLVCAPHFFGPHCDKQCIPPPLRGHCDTYGTLRCDLPFFGSNCNNSGDFILKISLKSLFIPACPCPQPSDTCSPICHPAVRICLIENGLNTCTQEMNGTADYSGNQHTTFGPSVGNLSNPVLFHLLTWSSKSKFQVIFYGNGQPNHLVGSFLVTPFLPVAGIATEGQEVRRVRKTFNNTGAILTLEYEVFLDTCTPQPDHHRVCDQHGHLVCDKDFYGPNCEKICVPTSHATCDNHGRLICNASFYGPKCNVHCVPAEHKQCDNNGNLRCLPNFHGTQCDIYCVSTIRGRCDTHGNLRCFPNYFGPNCSVHCIAIKHGTCDRNGTLACHVEFYGLNCDVFCKATPHGACDQNGTLVCESDFYGTACQTFCNETKHGSCNAEGDTICHQNFYGDSCDVFCINSQHGQCNSNGTLECEKDYFGALCEIFCNRSAGDFCNCTKGYTGRRCDVKLSGCYSQPCLNGGTCKETNNVDAYQCECPIEFTGTNCERLNVCAYSPCRHGQCTATSRSFHCSCKPGWTGFTCETDINECLQSVCPSGKTCINNLGSYTCLSCEQTLCRNNGTCSYKDLAPVCKCRRGWTGRDCSVADACLGNPCSHYKRCEAVPDGYYCHNVDDICSLTPCQNGGECRQNGHNFTCICRLGFKGETCHEVDRQPCLNGASYNTHTNTCSCARGWNGDTCNKTNHCASDPCNNNSSCVNSYDSYACLCQEGWRGHTCMTKDFCFNNPCNSGSTCLTSTTSFTCKCPPGKIGLLCNNTMNTCDPSPCLNNALCETVGGAVVCYCLGGWVGKICEIDVNECDNNPCPEPLSCVNFPGGFTCTNHEHVIRRDVRQSPRFGPMQPSENEASESRPLA
ncbi:neurogenic locus Notch protein-like [Mizuhopecten yessoensis]|uniref:Fibropellin-1 n=1 Tax=Mizuhopecten yessoensis TaxID=6573 RepID=A0A210PRD3_MIZYE|nr:neurogenic locus Notch protein-like [Mizuhopecten yessoensis]OWF38996.1 Fibropellin-1 [Mizuhopecten yessoensis]